MGKFKFESMIGIGLLVIAILGFILSVILSLPKSEQVQGRAQTLPEIPRDLFSSDNELTQQIRRLVSPSNIPVKAKQSNLGRKNVFENF
ncbi:MAG: hypothetical protein WD157_00350 [Patescibacteria group bacterium]